MSISNGRTKDIYNRINSVNNILSGVKKTEGKKCLKRLANGITYVVADNTERILIESS